MVNAILWVAMVLAVILFVLLGVLYLILTIHPEKGRSERFMWWVDFSLKGCYVYFGLIILAIFLLLGGYFASVLA